MITQKKRALSGIQNGERKKRSKVYNKHTCTCTQGTDVNVAMRIQDNLYNLRSVSLFGNVS